MGIVASAGSGKSATAKAYAKENDHVFVLSCIANRLNQSRRHWKPFETSAWYERFLYPNLMTA